jgi:hypothetical protein
MRLSQCGAASLNACGNLGKLTRFASDRKYVTQLETLQLRQRSFDTLFLAYRMNFVYNKQESVGLGFARKSGLLLFEAGDPVLDLKLLADGGHAGLGGRGLDVRLAEDLLAVLFNEALLAEALLLKISSPYLSRRSFGLNRGFLDKRVGVPRGVPSPDEPVSEDSDPRRSLGLGLLFLESSSSLNMW